MINGNENENGMFIVHSETTEQFIINLLKYNKETEKHVPRRPN